MDVFDAHLDSLRTCCATLPDKRTGNNTPYTMAALAVFFTQSAAFLTFQKALHQHYARSNAHTRLQRQRIPSDNPVCNLLDGTAYCRSERIACRHGSSRRIGSGRRQSFHRMPGATVLPSPPGMAVSGRIARTARLALA